MPNRILKESIRESDSIDSLSWFEEVLFYRLIVSCDDYGRFDGRTSVIKNRLFPLKDDLTLKTVSRAIERLVTAGLVALYEFEGKPYLYLPTWTAHQNVRAKRSKYPDPEAAGSSLLKPASICNHMYSDECNGNQPHANVPVIQSNTISESESLSVSESESESISGGGDAREELSEKELFVIGVKKEELEDLLNKKYVPLGPDSIPTVTRERVNRIVDLTEVLFRKYRPCVVPSAYDRRMVFVFSDAQDKCELLDYAFEKAQMAGKVSDWRYIGGIVHTLRKRNIVCREQAEEWDEERPDQNGQEEAAAALNGKLNGFHKALMENGA